MIANLLDAINIEFAAANSVHEELCFELPRGWEDFHIMEKLEILDVLVEKTCERMQKCVPIVSEASL
jgi:hypothetical protein